MATNGESGNGRNASGKIAFLRPQKIMQTNTNSIKITNVKCQVAISMIKGDVIFVFLLKWSLMGVLGMVRAQAVK